MKITFKDGSVLDKLVSVSISNVKRSNGKYTPIINIIFDKNVGFSDVMDAITDENVLSMVIETERETDNIVRTYEGFNKVYMNEHISDENHQFVVSIEKVQEVEQDGDESEVQEETITETTV